MDLKLHLERSLWGIEVAKKSILHYNVPPAAPPIPIPKT